MNLVSIIVPIYKVEQYLDLCVRTILQQSYENLEIILVDDGSPDRCGTICDEFAKQDNRIKVIHKSNGGLSDARNVGIDLAAGDYVTFVDSDDYLMPDMIENLMNIIVREHADIAQCGYIRTKSNCIERAERSQVQYKLYGKNRMSAFFKESQIRTMACGKIYKKSLFNEIRFPVGRLYEDVFTTYKLIHEADSVAVTNYIGYVYRINESSITMSEFSPKKLDSVYGTIERAEFIEKNYPNLRKQAYSGIVYACNQCLMQMAKSRYRGKVEDVFLQKLYRQYGRYYIWGKASFGGKTVALLAMLNEHFAKAVLSLKR